MKKAFLILILVSAAIVASCSSSVTMQPTTAEGYFQKGKEYFDDEDWLEAIKYFQAVLYQYPTSPLSDDAQYYLSEVYFNRKEFILAAFNYNVLRRTYSTSPFSNKALFKTGLCYYNLALPYDRDHEYVNKTIQAFSEFQAVYPKDSLYAEASKLIDEMRNRLAYRQLFTAELYRTMMNPMAATIYYDIVINQYPDTEYFEKAFIGKAECLIKMKKADEAVSLIEMYPRYFPKGTKRDYMQTLTDQARNLPVKK